MEFGLRCAYAHGTAALRTGTFQTSNGNVLGQIVAYRVPAKHMVVLHRIIRGDANGFAQGCLGVEIALRNLRKQPVPQELMLKPVVVDQSNYQHYETPMERRPCPTLESVAAR